LRGNFEPLTGTQDRDMALMAFGTAHITSRVDSTRHIFDSERPPMPRRAA
jgi:hypothetical protein